MKYINKAKPNVKRHPSAIAAEKLCKFFDININNNIFNVTRLSVPEIMAWAERIKAPDYKLSQFEFEFLLGRKRQVLQVM